MLGGAVCAQVRLPSALNCINMRTRILEERKKICVGFILCVCVKINENLREKKNVSDYNLHVAIIAKNENFEVLGDVL